MTDHVDEPAKTLLSHRDDVPAEIAVRCLLVTGIPLNSRGYALRRTLAAAITARIGRWDSTLVSKRPFDVIVRHNLHGHVRDGVCHVLFREAEGARTLLAAVPAGQALVHFEGSPLLLSFGASGIRDHFCPRLPHPIRAALQLDPTAVFSITAEVAAARMGGLLLGAMVPLTRQPWWYPKHSDNNLSRPHTSADTDVVCVADLTAGVGGNVIGLARAAAASAAIQEKRRGDGDHRSSCFHIDALEISAVRWRMLVHNVASAVPAYTGINMTIATPYPPHVNPNVATDSTENPPPSEERITAAVSAEGHRPPLDIRCLNTCCVAYIHAAHAAKRHFDCLLVDPPWGGADYKTKTKSATDPGADPDAAVAVVLGQQQELRRRQRRMETAKGEEKEAPEIDLPAQQHLSSKALLLLMLGAPSGDTLDPAASVGCPSPRPLAPVIALKLPRTYDHKALARAVTDAALYESTHQHEKQTHRNPQEGCHGNASPAERHFPFLFHFDASLTLFVVVTNPYAVWKSSEGEPMSPAKKGCDDCAPKITEGSSLCGGESSSQGPRPEGPTSGRAVLDAIVEVIQAWHGRGEGDASGAPPHPHPSQPAQPPPPVDEVDGPPDVLSTFEGGGVCRPEFYDFEKDRWIVLKKWIPLKRTRRQRADDSTH